MQLVPALPLPVSTPSTAGQLPADPAAVAVPASGKDGSAFAQLFPGLSPGEGPAPAPAGKTPAVNRLAGEAATSLFAGWFAALTPATPPPVSVTESGSGSLTVTTPGVATGVLTKGAAGLNAAPTPAADPLPGDATRAISVSPSFKGGPRSAPPAPAPAATSRPDATQPSESSVKGLSAALPPGQSPALPPAGTVKASSVTTDMAAAASETVASVGTLDATVEATPAVKPAGRAKISASVRGEKIASPESKADGTVNSAIKSADKKVLNANGKDVAGPNQSLGTDVAKTAFTMSNAAPSDRQSGAVQAPALVPAATVPLDRIMREAPAATGDTASIAHQAVEAAITAADRQVSGEPRAVNLQFSVGNADLNVRVEMRDGALHATFRTDSADLRDALAHEWQSVNSSQVERPFRLADPVFAPANPAGLAAAGDNAPQQQRHGGDRTGSPYVPARGSAPDPTASEPALQAVSIGPDSAPLSTSLHLHTFA